MKQRWLNLLLAPYVLALVLAAILILATPPLFQKYKAEISRTPLASRGLYLAYYDDLNADGLTEQVYFKNNRLGNAAFTVRDHRLMTVRQWNFPGEYVLGPKSFIIADMDDNQQREVYTYFLSGDSIYIGYCEPFTSHGDGISSIFVDTLVSGTTPDDVDVTFFDAMDYNRDGRKDILFTVNARFSLQPRNAYLFSPWDGRITKSPRGYSIISMIAQDDFDEDGHLELFTSTRSPGNVNGPGDYPYPDTSAWLFVFNGDLTFKYIPLEFNGSQTGIVSLPFRTKNNNYIASLVTPQNYRSELPSQFRVYDDELRLIRTINLDSLYGGFTRSVELIKLNGKLILTNSIDGRVFYLSPSLNLATLSKEGIDLGIFHLATDLDQDGLDEMVAVDKEGVRVYRDHLSDPAIALKSLELDAPSITSSVYLDGSGKRKFFVQNGETNFYLSYGKNPLFYLRYPYYLGVYLLSLLLVLVIRRLYKYQLDQRQKITDRIAQLQLRTIKSQFDPHLTFNVINSISYALNHEDKELANQYIFKLSAFMRGLLNDSEKVSRPLEDELSLISNYLEIERMRYRELFDYRINYPDTLDLAIAIPKNIVLIFVENAIKHGLRPKNGDGWMEIEIQKLPGYMEISVDDNGVGRRYKGEKAPGTGKGLEIVDQILDLYQNLTGKKITYKILDKVEGNIPAGTKVVIHIP